MAQYDSAYKLLFSHPDLVRDLLRGFVPEQWVQRLDFSTLEKVSGQFVSDDLRDRHNDLLWRVRLDNDHWIYLYLLLEFQSTDDYWMAIRLMTYIGLLYQDLARQRVVLPGQPLPPVFPIVLYNGSARWSGPLDTADLFEIPADSPLAAYKPKLRYFLLDERHLDVTTLPKDDNLVAQVLHLENSAHPQHAIEAVKTLQKLLHAPECDSVRRAFNVWIRHTVAEKLNRQANQLPSTETLEDIYIMLTEHTGQWSETWKREGLQQGLQQGRQEGQAALLTRLAERRFGPLSAADRARLEAATQAQLEAWADAILTAQSLAELFTAH
ncbi:Rpn family recombination-promoting nuclease/putative transposase [Pseudomonas aeruginosa]|uniref:Rpn family recombination-promoting nuclease/putative transposase n=1 Tax=Pseudomonas aeruginosa TaxID=287 RepID=UPI000BD9D5B3|nr:Rpn family recombination-promoting nuclease/putative transposase [Pseudomonas aeruginosa]MBG7380390.1 Rpn family recombination-promoting nuclease/putative transposase [Pseudomonas aeruginosa]MCM8660900.1 Rpn family recombination-promoting nuclease/putative transposase [Pseudomonas aeruginosa]MCM8696241.1 Rpn family recombination-promoting nuclease/putative transposase [Pseudomonas aeruginosa]MCP2650730.1 Rpn family recombination-promoting nuclease/putative transposase [Pseudomonas aeruginosa